MTSSSNASLFGRLAVKYKLITMAQLNAATAEQARTPSKLQLGQIFVANGWMTDKDVAKLLNVQKQVLDQHRKKQVKETPAAAEGVVIGQLDVPNGEQPAPAAKKKPTLAEEAPVPPTPATPSRPTPPPAAAPPSSPPTPAAKAAPAPSPQVAPQQAAVETPAASVATTVSTPQATPSVSATSNMPGTIDPEFAAILKQGVEKKASDIHLHSGAVLRMRINAEYLEVGDGLIDCQRAHEMALSILSESQRKIFEEAGELDLAYSLEGVSRFRVNMYRQQRGTDVVLRVVPSSPPSLEDLSMPGELASLTNFHQGMVLITGPVGCGKSSTLAALVNLINEERSEHILTVEDPIEYLHPSKRCLVNQRQVHLHTDTFGASLRAALREDPDVIVIGELRDYETISLALTAAETGHFVLGTLHTNSTIRTVNRLIGVFPPDQQSQVRTMLSEALKAVVSQRMVNRADGTGRVPAIEKLMITKPVGNLIRENKTFQLGSLLQTGKSQGMWLMDQYLEKLVKDGTITNEEALKICESPKAFKK